MASTRTSVTQADATQILVRMPIDLYEEVKARAVDEDRSMAQTIRQALRRYLQTAPA